MRDMLFDRVYGALIGAAIGDAMGGPIEMYDYEKIEALHGWVDHFLPYGDDFPPSAHGAWSQEAGTYTDDSRTSKILCRAILDRGAPPNRGDIAKAYIAAYHAAKEPLEREFLEDYYYKAIYGDRKLIFGGQPANAAIMGIAPIGVIRTCDPDAAYAGAFEAMFTTEGYARYAAAMAAAAISAAMIPGISPEDVAARMLETTARQKAGVEGDIFAQGGFYRAFCRKPENLTEKAISIAREYRDVKALRPALREAVVQEFFGDAAETLSIAMCMFVASEGSYRGTVEGCLNFGRDNDSSASVGGAIAGAFSGASTIPEAWIRTVEAKNPAPSFRALAEGLCGIIRREHGRQAEAVAAQKRLMGE